MAKFRKKPVVIEAHQFYRNWESLGIEGVCAKPECLRHGPHVHTLEGTSYRLEEGDWIIKGVKGEFYPCKPDIFEATYEPLSD